VAGKWPAAILSNQHTRNPFHYKERNLARYLPIQLKQNMIMVSGKLEIEEGRRDEFINRSKSSIAAARKASGCMDFSVTPDPLDPDRVNIFEEWESKSALDEFRGSGPADDLFKLVRKFAINERQL